MDTLFMDAEEVARQMNVSKAYAYKVIHRLNEEDGICNGCRKSEP